MPFLYPHHPRDRPGLYRTNSWDDDHSDLPTKPAPTVTVDSYSDGRERTSKSPRGRSRRDGLSRIQSHERRQRKLDRSQDADRQARRRGQRSEDPEREARRQRRREERRQDPEREARRQERKRARKAERKVARQLERERQRAEELAERGHPLSSTPEGRHRLSPVLESSATSHDGQDTRTLSRETRSSHSPRRQPPRTDSWRSSEDGWSVDLEKSQHNEKRHRRSRPPSMWEELDWYKRGAIPEGPSRRRHESGLLCCCCCCGSHWSRRKQCTVLGLIVLSIITLIIIIATAAAASKYSYTVSTAQVNNTAAFTSGGATRNGSSDTNDGIGAGADTYTYYSGNASSFPAASQWISFEDMWTNNLATVKTSCSSLGYGADNTAADISDMYDAVQDRANASLVDHRLILAVILQESHGCVHVPTTTSSGGVRNPGLMQTHDGHAFNAHHPRLSILAMVQDGTQGTRGKNGGDGLVQYLDTYGNPYEAVRGYNSGYVPTNGNLSEAAGATACYVSDIANRLTGWVTAENTCSS